MNIIDMILNVDQSLAQLLQWLGPWLYLLIFLVIFAETGLIVTPFLPGDSLLFALGALCAMEGSGLNVYLMAGLLMIAAFVGDNVNYAVGSYIGPRAFQNPNSKIFKKQYLDQTKRFYAKHGAKAVVIARFAPILRTFVPFVAGVGAMPKKTFVTYNVVGAVVWVNSFLFAGYIFGNLPIIKRNFHVVVVAVVILSLVPVVIEYIRARREMRAQ